MECVRNYNENTNNKRKIDTSEEGLKKKSRIGVRFQTFAATANADVRFQTIAATVISTFSSRMSALQLL